MRQDLTQLQSTTSLCSRSDLPSSLERSATLLFDVARGLSISLLAGATNRLSAFCTKFGLKHVQNPENNYAFCTIFDLKHVQTREKLPLFVPN
ncbi:hypothetical protein HMPREF1583_01472 [Gardnerella vaginalis JCP8151B]|nr:hypothetical protein HMPREF1583_01472 [Gardnerella vaginalis JCP8151B]